MSEAPEEYPFLLPLDQEQAQEKAWNNYLWPKVILQNKDAITMPMLVANLLGNYTVDYGMLMLGVLICTIPTAIIFFAFQKSFTEGITFLSYRSPSFRFGTAFRSHP